MQTVMARNTLQFVSGELKHGAAGGGLTSQTFFTSASERMRIDSSGTVLIGKTSSSFSTVGSEFRSGGVTILGRSGGEPLTLNRTSNDGGIINFNKDNTLIGNIGTASGYLVIGSPVGSDAHLLIGNGLIHPATSTGGGKDNAIDIGGSSNRFKDPVAIRSSIC